MAQRIKATQPGLKLLHESTASSLTCLCAGAFRTTQQVCSSTCRQMRNGSCLSKSQAVEAITGAGTWQGKEQKETELVGDRVATTKRQHQQQSNRQNTKARAQRVFPPTNADQRGRTGAATKAAAATAPGKKHSYDLSDGVDTEGAGDARGAEQVDKEDELAPASPPSAVTTCHCRGAVRIVRSVVVRTVLAEIP